MALPELTLKRIQKLLDQFCERVPHHLRHKVRLLHTYRGNSVSLLEERADYRDPSRSARFPVAQFRLSKNGKTWALYWRDRNLRWHLYEAFRPSNDFKDLLGEVDRDPTGIFWG